MNGGLWRSIFVSWNNYFYRLSSFFNFVVFKKEYKSFLRLITVRAHIYIFAYFWEQSHYSAFMFSVIEIEIKERKVMKKLRKISNHEQRLMRRIFALGEPADRWFNKTLIKEKRPCA